MTKSNIGNFQEFCGLRDAYVEMIADYDRDRTSPLPELERWKVGTFDCILCTAATEAEQCDLDNLHTNKCDYCMWKLREDKVVSSPHCLDRTSVSYDNDNVDVEDIIDSLRERTIHMGLLIEAYYNLEE